MKKLSLVCFAILIPGFTWAVSPLLWNKMNSFSHKNATKLQSSNIPNQYANFIGNWKGSCDDDPEAYVLNINQDEDSSNLVVDNQQLAIDAINNFAIHENSLNIVNTLHLRWNENGQQLIGNLHGYTKAGNLSQGNFDVGIGNFVWSIENGKMILNNEFTLYRDGKLIVNDKTHCVLSKV